MMSNRDLERIGNRLSRVYHEPRKETVQVPPPPPYEVDVEEEVLVSLPDGGQEVTRPKLKVSVGAEDYPQKKIRVRRLEKTVERVEETQDMGPTSLHRTVAFAIWAVCLVLGVIALATKAVYFFLPATGAVIGVAVFVHLRRTRRRLETVLREVVGWKPTTGLVTIDVDPRYAPRTEERLVPNEERVTSIGMVRFHFEAVKLGSGTVLLDGSGLLEAPEFILPVLPRWAEIEEATRSLDATIEQLPALLTGERRIVSPEVDTSFREGVPLVGEEHRVHELLQRLGSLFREETIERFRPNLVPSKHPAVSLLEVCDPAGDSKDPANASFRSLAEAIDREEADGREAKMLDFLSRWDENQAVLAAVRHESLDGNVAPNMLALGLASHYSSFNFYCPLCHEEVARSMLQRDYSLFAQEETKPVYFSRNSRCVYEPETREWRCRTCGATVPANRLIAIHKILDDVLYPAYDRLMEENRVKRLEMDGKTRDHAMAYENQRSQERDAIAMGYTRDRGTIQSNIGMMQAEIVGQRQAIEAIVAIMGAYRMEQTTAMRDIGERCQTIQREIADTASRRREAADAGFEKVLQSYGSGMETLGKAKRQEEVIRDQIQRQILAATVITAVNAADIARNTADIAVSGRETASHAADIAQSSRRTASNTDRIADSTRVTAANTTRMVSQLDRIDSGVRAGFGAVVRGIEEGNAISTAIAAQQGIDLNEYAWYRVDKNIPKLVGEVQSDLLGEGAKARALRQARMQS